MISSGFGWKLAAFDSSTRLGEVVGANLRIPFDKEACEAEPLRVGDDVFVLLQSSHTRVPHVRKVWPCVARLPLQLDLPAAPTLAEHWSASLASVMRLVPSGARLCALDFDGKILAATTWCHNAYGIAGLDLTMHGALVVGEETLPFKSIQVAHVRLAEPHERASSHAKRALGAEDVLIALVQARSQFDPARPASVALLRAERVRWLAAPLQTSVNEATRTLLHLTSDALAELAATNEGLFAHCVSMGLLPRETPADQVRSFRCWCALITNSVRHSEDDGNDFPG